MCKRKYECVVKFFHEDDYAYFGYDCNSVLVLLLCKMQKA